MAMRAASMGAMNPVDMPPTLRQSDSLFRKLVLLVLLISAAVLWIVVWFEYETSFPLLLSTFFADTTLGMIAGFGSRFILRNRDWFLRYLFAILIAMMGMFMIGWLTNWVLGVGPIRLEEKFAEQIQAIRLNPNLWNQIRSLGIGGRVLFNFSNMNWADLVHLAITMVITVLSLQAWRRTASPPASEPIEIVPAPTPAPVPASRPTRTRSRRSRRSSASSNGRTRVQPSGNGSSHLIPSLAPQPGVRSNNGSRASVRNRVKKLQEPVRTKKKRLLQRKPKIQFALVEEHRCPYCLDNVSRNDPRGVKECEVCHTLHHADCWAITGVCQVPHLNT